MHPACKVWCRSHCGEPQFPSWSATFALTFDTLLVQLLAKLLKSKNPDDLQEANKLIKSMVKEVSGLGLGCGWRSPQHGAEVLSLGIRLALGPCHSPQLEAVDGIEQWWVGLLLHRKPLSRLRLMVPKHHL